jgi:hypothetical protein
MQQNSVIQSARGRWLAGAAVIAGTVLVSACGSSNPTPATSASASATPTSSAVAAAPTVSSTPAAPVSQGTPASTPTTPVNPGGTNAATTTCAHMAAHNTYLYVTQAQPASGGALTLTVSPAKLICGGPDDSHYDVARNIETAHVAPNATIEVFPTTSGQMRDVPIQASQLSSYLKTDHDTRIFLVGGPVSSITSLQEQYHP